MRLQILKCTQGYCVAFGGGWEGVRVYMNLLADDPNVGFNPLAIRDTPALAGRAFGGRCAPEPDLVKILEAIRCTASIC